MHYTSASTPTSSVLDLAQNRALFSSFGGSFLMESNAITGLPGCVIMRHPYRIVSIRHRKVPIMRTIAWVIILAVIAANEPCHLLKTIVEFISTLIHFIGL